MPRYLITKKKYPVVDTGSMNCRITINTRQIKAPVGLDVNFNETFVTLFVCWAMIETVKGLTIFDSTNTEKIVTHRFFMRKPSFEITSEQWISYRGINYKILDIEELAMETRFLCLLATSRGDDTRSVNYA